MGKNRKGMALITVVLIAALFLISIIGISAKVISDKKVSNARAHSQRALAVAETGLANVVQRIRTDEDVKEQLASGNNYDSGEVPYDSGISSVDSTYRVKIVGIDDGYTFYSLATICSKTNGNVLARKVITVEYSGDFPISDFGLFSASNIKIQNGTVDADIFANTSIYVREDDELVGTAYCSTPGGITGGLSEDKENYNCRTIPFPEIVLDPYKDLWIAFLNGYYPYDGTVEGYPNTGYSEALGDIHAYIQSKLHTTSDAATQTDFESFFADIKNQDPTSPEAAYLGSFINSEDCTLIYYIKPDEHKDTVGGATINGLLYIIGTTKHGNDPALSVKGTGGLTCNGSIVAQGTINLNSQLTVTWKQNKIYEEEIKTSIEEGQESKLSPVPSSWEEISYEESPFSP